ncbi:MAG: hypothetical protein AAGI68_05060 [Planctomycetota bacterium]
MHRHLPLMLTLAGALLASPSDPAADGLAPHPDRPKLIVSEETTYFTQPLNPDGTVEYIAALNTAARGNMQPEENAAAHIIALLPESEPPDQDLNRLATALGVALEPDRVRLQPIPWDLTDDRDPFDRALDGPWTRQDLPRVARWLDANAEAFDAFTQAVRVPDSYWPHVEDPSNPYLLAALFPALSEARGACRALLIRFHAQWAAGQHEQAVETFHTCLNLSHHVGRQQSLIAALTALSIRGLTHASAASLLNDPNLSPAAARRLLATLQASPPLLPVAPAINHHERTLALRFFQNAYARPDQLNDTTDVIFKFAARSRMFDINTTLKEINRAYDFAFQSAEIETFAEREQSARAIEAQFTIVHPLIMLDPDKPLRERFSRRIAQAFLDIIVPALLAAGRSQLQYRTQSDLLLTAAALTVYRLDRDRYPESLGDLVPEYLTKLPVDRYDGRPLTYRPGPDGQTYLLYSIGSDGEDDHGVFDYRDGDISIGNPLPDGW